MQAFFVKRKSLSPVPRAASLQRLQSSALPVYDSIPADWELQGRPRSCASVSIDRKRAEYGFGEYGLKHRAQ